MPIWWTQRQHGERTATYLARVLDAADEGEMASAARLYHYDDYFCPDDIDDGMNIHRLISDLRRRPYNPRTEAIIQAAMDGEFDATRQESDEWAASPDGQRALADLQGSLAEAMSEMDL
jgi:hypothetical protein